MALIVERVIVMMAMKVTTSTLMEAKVGGLIEVEGSSGKEGEDISKELQVEQRLPEYGGAGGRVAKNERGMNNFRRSGTVQARRAASKRRHKRGSYPHGARSKATNTTTSSSSSQSVDMLRKK
ncbi:uncharacterized protein MEPE_03292 [Melanopsichium pennsylvanicum]|uniref:Uncharacterized protein n=2 Tax=Melanopsichium pennsylvanicum TaxID=63383 RepID=A0AAJ5C5H8_9BASI|nr:uncharacterized protein BN887_06095 [Melanopsichium pennsylvanicum 4]SNX84583.1 uncharacterized protein MEPE_03292 [Melanopsichium pennsylvanicum]